MTETADRLVPHIGTNPNDWLLLAASQVPYVCIRKKRPRTWVLRIPVQAVLHGSVQQMEISFAARESTEAHPEARINETLLRLAQIRQALFLEVETVLNSGRICGMEYRALYPLGVAIGSILKPAVRAIAEDAVERDVEFLPAPGVGHPWTIRHKPTGVFVFYFIPDGFTDLPKEERNMHIREAVAKLDAAVGARAGSASPIIGGETPC